MVTFFSASQTTPSSVHGVASWSLHLMKLHLLNTFFSHKPHAAHIFGRVIVRLLALNLIKSQGHISTHVLQPIHEDSFSLNSVISFVLFVGIFSEINTAFHGQV